MKILFVCHGNIYRSAMAEYLIIGMDERNIHHMKQLFGGDPARKIRLLSEYGHFEGEVEDPWYTGRFEKVFDEIRDGLQGILENTSQERALS